MWLPITLISMIFCAMVDIMAKKTVSGERNFNILKLRISTIFVDTILLIIMWVFYYRGTETSPWVILVENPALIIVASLNALDVFFYLQALKYIGLTIQEAYWGVSSILIFVGMIFINLVFGKISDAESILVPAKFITIVILLVSSFILPRLKGPSNNETVNISKLKKRNVVIGLLFTFAAFTLEAIETLLLTFIFSENEISFVDYFSASILVTSFWGIVFYGILYFKTHKVFNPMKKGYPLYLIYGLFNAAFTILYLFGVSLAPVESNIFWVAYPIIPIIGSALFLKERYSVKQYICIALIAMSSASFGLLDYIL